MGGSWEVCLVLRLFLRRRGWIPESRAGLEGGTRSGKKSERSVESGWLVEEER